MMSQMTSSITRPGPSDFLQTARRVIAREADALLALGTALDENFARAVDLILAAKGRVIVSGMGKSGHIARKIAATFASTGTPAQFVHPAEASHGDLGMVMRGDVLLILSNSGETPELADILAHAGRFDIPLIGIAGRDGSTLLRQSDVALLLPSVAEACDTGIVPTTSTTMTLALGDALAVALMEHRQFTPDHFRLFHPGGKLGAKLMTTPMSETLLTISKKGFGVVGVQDAEGYLLGIVTDGDLRRHMDGLLTLTAGQVMTANPRTIGADALAEKALAVMNDRKITCLFVTEDDSRMAIGILHIHDLLRAGIA
jgi:arabinose-5-phosphate isomerase